MNCEDLSNTLYWFNNIDIDTKNNLILMIYRLCLNSKEIAVEKLIENINNHWKDKLESIKLTNEQSVEKLNIQYTDKIITIKNENEQLIEKLNTKYNETLSKQME